MASTIKAQIAPVRVGHLVIEGLMTKDERFYVSIPQVVDRFTIDTQQPARYFKGLLGKGLTIDTVFEKIAIEGTRVTVNAMTIDTFEILITKLDRSGNKAAQDFRDDLVGLSLRQLFADAFNLEFEKKERQEWLKTRQVSRQVRRSFTDVIKDYLDRNPDLSPNAVKFMYSNASDAINRAVFARPAKKLCEDLHVPDKDLLRDYLTVDELRHVQEVEDLAMRLIDLERWEPLAAVNEARTRLVIPVSNRVA